MKFFLDTGNLDEIRDAASLGVLDGVTTNPTLVAKEGEQKGFKELIREICEIVKGPVSAEVISTDIEGIKVNVTLVFSPSQALLAAKAGATYVSPFVGRLDDVSNIGMDIVRDIVGIYKNYGYPTQVLVASIRHPIHIVEAARAGAHIATMPYKVFKQLINHPLTDVGLERFLSDWGNQKK